MYQPDSAAYISLSTGYGNAHGLPDYTFEQTSIGGGGGSGGGLGRGGGGSGSGGYTAVGGGAEAAATAAGAAAVGSAIAAPGTTGAIFSPGPAGPRGSISGNSVSGPASRPLFTTHAGNSFHAHHSSPHSLPPHHTSSHGGHSQHHQHQQSHSPLSYVSHSLSPSVGGSTSPSSPASISQLPPQQQQHHHHHHHQQQQQQYQHSRFDSQVPRYQTPSSIHQQRHHIKMEATGDDHSDLAAAQGYQEYQPELNGLPVGDKLPSTAITEEYAKADPVYVQKTRSLPAVYSHYRPMLGDGNCGWRAIGFGYFETLIKLGNKAQVDGERERLESLNEYIQHHGGFDPMVFVDFVEETDELLKRISDKLNVPEEAMDEVMHAFTDAEKSNAIIYHLRLLASSWLKENRGSHEAFITTDDSVEKFCQRVIEVPNIEIDQLGLQALVSILLKPVGFVLRIAYLDRSPGSEVNTYSFPEEAISQPASPLDPVICLLYRPDHYDILYPVDLTPPPAPMNIQVFRATIPQYEITSAPPFTAAGDYDLLAALPGFSSSPSPLGALGVGLGPSLGSPLAPFTQAPTPSWMSAPFGTESLQPVATPLPIAAAAPPPPPPQQTHPLRFSEYCQMPEYVENDTWREPTFQTSTFKNSHFNVAHYNNPNFQPEEYKPENDEYDPPPRSGRKRGSV
ncbi:peptidase C65 Otubain-domain-containing protein [Neurospora hispaniola]|uniref:ubiquitinyl hydrolase 1 n=1 Tax=Neurospora hispaniola TaxID=588809 RepID=A0AAJ0ID77_9PEZI|nr:peptidase C65 Otubain-domain-containing protein [Neurospora hispaniola]